MSMPALRELLRRRWWVILTVVALALAAAGAYAWRQRKVYESTVTLYIHPSHLSVAEGSPALISSELSQLSYGSLENTLASIAESRTTLASAASPLGITPDRLTPYTVVATLRPKSFVMDVSVDGPNPRLVVALANQVSPRMAGAVSTDYPVVALRSLDAASTSSLIRPRLKRDLVYAGLAGLILGFVLASLRVSFVPATRKPKRPSSGRPGDGENARADETATKAAEEVPAAR
jgi:capsular polysaccharide biosynthesis protein